MNQELMRDPEDRPDPRRDQNAQTERDKMRDEEIRKEKEQDRQK